MDPRNLNPASQQQEEEEINICLRLNKTVHLKIKGTDTVRNLKALLREKEGISKCLLELFSNDDELKDEQKLTDCGIQQNSTVDVFIKDEVKMILHIKMPFSENMVVIEAKPNDTVQTIKVQIGDKEGICLEQYNLVYAGKVLEENESLAHLNIQGGSTLHILQNPKDRMLISVKMPSGEIVKAEVKLLHTIRDVKIILESILDLPLNEMALTFEGIQLQESKTLSSYNIKEESMLEMLSPTFPIFIKSPLDKTITFSVHGHDLVKNVKIQIIQKFKITTYFHLMFEGKRLKNDRDLASYNIQKDCTLHMVFWQSTLICKIKLSLAGTLYLPYSTTIHDLKKKLQRAAYKPVRDLIIKGEVLESQFTMADYGINKDTVIDVALEGSTEVKC